jgi:hypothetical protein
MQRKSKNKKDSKIKKNKNVQKKKERGKWNIFIDLFYRQEEMERQRKETEKKLQNLEEERKKRQIEAQKQAGILIPKNSIIHGRT